MEYPVIAVIGGFLGAGKTTLILAAVRRLREQGLRAAVIFNDQGDDLVDARFAECQGVANDQVVGGCFCCRFPELVQAAERLLAADPDVIFAEAVGSCTDLVATTLRPLLQVYGDRLRIAPLTVLAHPRRDFSEDPDLDFLYQNQLAEADLILDRDEVDAVTGKGVSEWLDLLLHSAAPVAVKSLAIDYARYAAAEAALAWLNVCVVAEIDPPVGSALLIGPLLDRLQSQIRIVHLKVLVQSDAGWLKAAMTGNGQEPIIEGMLDASPSARHEVVLNVRSLTSPESLREIVEGEFKALSAELTWRRMQCFRPSPPVPYRRITSQSPGDRLPSSAEDRGR